MQVVRAIESSIDVKIDHYHKNDLYKIFPFLKLEFPEWTGEQRRNYLEIVTEKLSGSSGVLLAKNQFGYVLGILIYSLHSVEADFFSSIQSSKKKINIFAVENLISDNNFLQKKIYLSLIDGAFNFARKLNCLVGEIPSIDNENMLLVKNTYALHEINTKNSNTNQRTYINLDAFMTH